VAGDDSDYVGFRAHGLMCAELDGAIRLRLRKTGDDGFTIIEVAIAAFILFFMLTAMYSLVVASYRQTVVASRQSIATNLATSLFEQVRAMPYASIGDDTVDDAGDVLGALLSVETTTYHGVDFTIEQNVEWVDDDLDLTGDEDDNENDYKLYTVTLRWASLVGVESSLTMSTKIRDTTAENVLVDIDLEWTMGWEDPDPAERVVLFHDGTLTNPTVSEVWDGERRLVPEGTVEARLEASCTIPTQSDSIMWVKFQVDSNVIYDPYHLPNSALFSLGSGTYQWAGGFYINTLAETEESNPDQPLQFPDGSRQIEFEVMTFTGAVERRFLNVVVDNDPPFWPDYYPTPTEFLDLVDSSDNDARFDTETVLEYPVAADGWRDWYGTIPYAAVYYDIGIDLTLSDDADDFENVFLEDYLLGSSGEYQDTFTVDPFMPIRMRLWPRSETGRRTTVAADFNTDWYITNPRLDPANCSAPKIGPKYHGSLVLSDPNFGSFDSMFTTAAIDYNVYEDSSYAGSGNLETVKDGYSLIGFADISESFEMPNQDRYYQVQAVLPVAWSYSDQGSVWSNVILWDASDKTFEMP